jgi:hypothetical protein
LIGDSDDCFHNLQAIAFVSRYRLSFSHKRSGVNLHHCGRMDNAVWAPQFQSVRFLDDAGRNLTVKNKSELTQVRAVELTEAARSRCPRYVSCQRNGEGCSTADWADGYA